MKKIITSIKENKILASILILAAILRLYNLDFQSLWLDELYTMNVVNPDTSFFDMIKDVTYRESFPYLYFIIVKIFFFLFGYESFIARFPSVIFGVLCVYIIYKIGKQLVNKNVGIIAALFLTINQFSLYNSQDARAYTFYLFFVILSYYMVFNFIQSPNKKNALKYGLTAGLLLNTNFFAVANVLAQGFLLLIFIILLIKDKNEKKQNIKYLFIAIGVTFLLFIPNIYKFYLTTQFYSTWIPAPTNGGMTLMLKEMLTDSEFVLFFMGLLITFYFIKVFNYPKLEGYYTKNINKKTIVFVFLTSWIVLPIFLVVIKSYLSTPLYVTRYLYSILPAILIIFAIALDYIKDNIVKYTFLFLVLFSMLFDTVVVKKYYNVPLKSQFREASDMVKFYNPNKHVVYSSLKYFYDFYLNRRGVKFETVEKSNLKQVIQEMQTAQLPVSSFWVVDGYADIVKLDPPLQGYLDANFRLEETYDGLGAIARHYIKK